MVFSNFTKRQRQVTNEEPFQSFQELQNVCWPELLHYLNLVTLFLREQDVQLAYNPDPNSYYAFFPQLHRSVPPGVSIASTPDFTNWKMDIQVLDENPLYKGQTYRLNFKFSNAYPIGSSAANPMGLPASPTTYLYNAPTVSQWL